MQPFFFQMNPYHTDDPGLSLDPGFTTVMLRNIPNKYTAKMLLDVLDKRFAKQYDYVYLPVDFVNHCNVGYAFINLRSPESRIKFYKHFHNQKVKDVLPGFNSKKVLKQVCEVNKAKVQGAKENIRRIRQMNMLMQRLKEHPEWVPLIFDQDGKAIPLDLDGVTEAEERILEKKGTPPRASPDDSQNSMDRSMEKSNSFYGSGAESAPHTAGKQTSRPYGSPNDSAHAPHPYMYQHQGYPAAGSWEQMAYQQQLANAQKYEQQLVAQNFQNQAVEQILAFQQAHAAYQNALSAAATYANRSPQNGMNAQSAYPSGMSAGTPGYGQNPQEGSWDASAASYGASRSPQQMYGQENMYPGSENIHQNMQAPQQLPDTSNGKQSVENQRGSNSTAATSASWYPNGAMMMDPHSAAPSPTDDMLTHPVRRGAFTGTPASRGFAGTPSSTEWYKDRVLGSSTQWYTTKQTNSENAGQGHSMMSTKLSFDPSAQMGFGMENVAPGLGLPAGYQ